MLLDRAPPTRYPLRRIEIDERSRRTTARDQQHRDEHRRGRPGSPVEGTRTPVVTTLDALPPQLDRLAQIVDLARQDRRAPRARRNKIAAVVGDARPPVWIIDAFVVEVRRIEFDIPLDD